MPDPHAPLVIAVDDPGRTDVRDLIAAHLLGMQASSPPESVHALDGAGLRHPSVTLFSARRGEELAGIGAVKRLDAHRGEVKSMRVADAFLGTGVGRAVLRHLMGASREAGMTSLWLETGSTDEFVAGRRLYLSEGFALCGPFDGYPDDPFSVFMTRRL